MESVKTIPEPKANGKDRRRNARFRVKSIAYVDLGPDNGGTLMDVSEGGISFQGIQPLQTGQVLPAKIKLPGTQQSIKATGQITWLNESRKGGGMRFVNCWGKPKNCLSNGFRPRNRMFLKNSLCLSRLVSKGNQHTLAQTWAQRTGMIVPPLRLKLIWPTCCEIRLSHERSCCCRGRQQVGERHSSTHNRCAASSKIWGPYLGDQVQSERVADAKICLENFPDLLLGARGSSWPGFISTLPRAYRYRICFSVRRSPIWVGGRAGRKRLARPMESRF